MKTSSSIVAGVTLLVSLMHLAPAAWTAETPPAKVAYLGVTIEPIDDTLREQLKLGRGAGVRIQRVMEDSPAQQAGLKAHDILLRLNDQLVFNAHQLSALVRSLATGENVTLEVIRRGERRRIEATLGETEWREPEAEAGPGRSVTIWDLGDGGRVETWLHRDLEKSLKDAPGPPDTGKPVTFLGVELAPVDPPLAAQLGLEEEEAGALVRLVLDDSPAEKAGIQTHDVIVRVDGKAVKGPSDLTDRIREHKKGDRVVVGVLRAGKPLELEAILSERAGGRPTGMRKLLEEYPRVPQLRLLPRDPGDSNLLLRLEGVQDANAARTVTSQKVMMIQGDDGVTTTVTEENGRRHVTVKDAKERVVFDGPVNSEEERRNLPADIRARIEKIEKGVGSGAGSGGDDRIRELRLLPRHDIGSAI